MNCLFAVILTFFFYFMAGRARAETLSSQPTALTNAAQIRSLSVEQAANSIPVLVTGAVMVPVQNDTHSLIVIDDSGGVYAASVRRISLHCGDLVEVRGVTDPGHFAPMIDASSVKKIGTRSIPQAQPVTFQQIASGGLDAQWIETKGVVRRFISPSPGSDVWRVVIASDGGFVPVRFAAAQQGQIQVDAEIDVKALCFYQYNQKRQALNPVLEVPRGISIEVKKPALPDPFAIPVRTVTSLMTFSPDNATAFTHRVHVKGIVTAVEQPSTLWIRDRMAGLRIQTAQGMELRPGDEVEVAGFPTFGPRTPTLEDSIFRKTSLTSAEPVPMTVTNIDEIFQYENDLVSLDGRLTAIQTVAEGLNLSVENRGRMFNVFLASANNPKKQFKARPGSKVRITGICSLVYNDPRPYAGVWQPDAFEIFLRAPSDLVVLQPPSWWTAKHIGALLGAATGMLALALGVSMMLSRRRLLEQERQRQLAETEFAAILSERNRMARELHDTLAQGLVAISIQLRLAKKYITDGARLVLHLNAAQNLVHDNLTEARASIWNMRSQILETTDLAGALRGVLKQLSKHFEIQAGLTVEGTARRLAPAVENNILKIGQEAITNAVKHARAKNINVKMQYNERQFRIITADDGCGFSFEKPVSGEGGFGISGMRERAAQLNGTLNVDSAPGKGTTIELTIPLPEE